MKIGGLVVLELIFLALRALIKFVRMIKEAFLLKDAKHWGLISGASIMKGTIQLVLVSNFFFKRA